MLSFVQYYVTFSFPYTPIDMYGYSLQYLLWNSDIYFIKYVLYFSVENE